MPSITITGFANTVDPDESAHKEPSHVGLQCLPSGHWIFNIILVELKVCLFLQNYFIVSFYWSFKS